MTEPSGQLWWEQRTAELPPLMREVVQAIAPAWVATQPELEDEARLVMGAFATWLDGLPPGLRAEDIVAEVRRQTPARVLGLTTDEKIAAARAEKEIHQPCGDSNVPGEHGGPDDRHCLICTSKSCVYNQPDTHPYVVGNVFSPRKGAGACLWSVGTTAESHGDMDILLMSDGTVHWQKHKSVEEP